MSAASDDFPPPEDEPTRALLLAQALDMCISAERRLPGSADQIIAHQPTWAREELRRLVSLAGSLDAVATGALMSDEFREAARGRLLQRIRGGGTGASTASLVSESRWAISAFPSTTPSTNGHHVPRSARRGSPTTRLLWRAGLGGVLAATLATAATLTASATALPGEPLYPIKQAQEELGLRLAPDDQARAIALLNQGDARLNETARLLQAGRASDIAQTTRRFDEAIDRATTTFVVTIAESPATTSIETKLSAQQAQLQSLILSAPEPARADLRQALMATERGLALVADTQPDHVADNSTASRFAITAPVPTTAAETIPTLEPPQLARATSRPVSTVPDKHDASASLAEAPSGDTVAEAPAEASPPAQTEVAVGRGERGGAVLNTSHRDERAHSVTSDDQKEEQHFEPVATQSGTIVQAPQVSQAPVVRHLDITLSHDDSEDARGDTHEADERQVVMPTTTHGDEHPQVAEQPAQPANVARSQGSRANSDDEGRASSNGATTSTSRAQPTQAPATTAGDAHGVAARGDDDKSSRTDNAVGSRGGGDQGGKGGADQGGKGGADQGGKGGADSGGKGGGDSGSKGSAEPGSKSGGDGHGGTYGGHGGSDGGHGSSGGEDGGHGSGDNDHGH